MITKIMTLAASAPDMVEKASETAEMSFGEIAAYGGRMALFGMGVVFAVLILLWGVLTLFQFFFSSLEKDKSKKTSDINSKQKQPTEITQEITEEVQVQAEASVDSKKLVAVITAAISAYREKSGEGSAFRVVSFKKR